AMTQSLLDAVGRNAQLSQADRARRDLNRAEHRQVRRGRVTNGGEVVGARPTSQGSLVLVGPKLWWLLVRSQGSGGGGDDKARWTDDGNRDPGVRESQSLGGLLGQKEPLDRGGGLARMLRPLHGELQFGAA